MNQVPVSRPFQASKEVSHIELGIVHRFDEPLQSMQWKTDANILVWGIDLHVKRGSALEDTHPFVASDQFQEIGIRKILKLPVELEDGVAVFDKLLQISFINNRNQMADNMTEG
jgi:hypothetical protein